MKHILIFVLLIQTLLLQAQFGYVLDQTIPVRDQNNEAVPMPWTGGINAAQYNALDLDGDNKNDLVLYDRMANKVITYINRNNQYEYAPEYEDLFPEDATNWILLRDYNCDGKNDLFTSDILGIKVYTNTTRSGEKLSWEKYLFYVDGNNPKSEVLLTKGFLGLINLQLQYDDLPSLQDVDGDGDLDILNMRFTGNGTAEFHQNFSKEKYGTCDSLAFERITQKWGNFTECGCGVFAFNGDACPTSGRMQHAGGKSLLALDVDGDNDLDLLFSEASCTKLYWLENSGTTSSPILNASFDFPLAKPVDFYIFPAGFYEDVDFDGVKDFLVTPNIYSKTYFNTDLSTSNWFYKNTGTTQQPELTFIKDNFLQDKMIDLGDNAVPAFADVDADGDYDMFISQHATDNFLSSIYFYKNTGTITDPQFMLSSSNYINFASKNLYNVKIQFADMNGDSKIDLVFSGTKNQSQTALYYIANQSSGSFNFDGQELQTINFTISYSENFYVSDIDLDGKPDILLGKSNGAVEYWKNDGSSNFSLKEANFLNLKASLLRKNAVCTIADLDGNGGEDFVYSDQAGKLNIISNFRYASGTNAPIIDVVFNPLTSTYTTHNFGTQIWPTAVNLFNADKPAIVLGTILGGIQVLKNDGGNVIHEEPQIKFYPNPVQRSELLHITVDREASLQVISALGQIITESVFIPANELYSLSVQKFPRGIYFLRFSFNKKTYTRRLVIY